MKQSLQLKVGQQLTMTPQLQQAIRLLQLSTLDLQQEIQSALDSNPLLELEEENDTPEQDSNIQSKSSDTKNDSSSNENEPTASDADSEWAERSEIPDLDVRAQGVGRGRHRETDQRHRRLRPARPRGGL